MKNLRMLLVVNIKLKFLTFKRVIREAISSLNNYKISLSSEKCSKLNYLYIKMPKIVLIILVLDGLY